MRAFSNFVIAFIFIFATAAVARDVKVASSRIKVTPPAGYCELDQTNKADSAYLKSATDISASAGTTLVALFPDCKELNELRTSQAFVPTKVLIAAETASMGKASASMVTETCKVLKEQGEKLAANNNKEMQANVKKNSVNTLQDNQFIGVLEDKGNVCFSAQTLKISTPQGDARVLNVFATMLIRNILFFCIHFPPMSTRLQSRRVSPTQSKFTLILSPPMPGRTKERPRT